MPAQREFDLVPHDHVRDPSPLLWVGELLAQEVLGDVDGGLTEVIAVLPELGLVPGVFEQKAKSVRVRRGSELLRTEPSIALAFLILNAFILV